MASIPQLYSDDQFSSDLFSADKFVANNFNPKNCAMLRHPHINYPFFHGGVEFDGYLSENEAFSRVPVIMGYFSDQFGVNSDTAAAVPCSSNSSSYFDNKFDFVSNIAATGCKTDQNNYSEAVGIQFSDGNSCEYGEDCCGFVPNFNPVCAELPGENWGLQCNEMTAIEQSNIKVGRYTVEERKDRILKYLKKRNQRNFNKTIKYACRKTLADRRIRVRGRFARNNEFCEEEETRAKKHDNPLQDKESHDNDSFERKNEEDEWLEEAVASLIYVPYIESNN